MRPPSAPRALLALLSLLLPALAAAQGDIRDEPLPKEKARPLNLAFRKPEDGLVEVEADEQDWIDGVSWVGIGHVTVTYGSLKLAADRIRVDLVSTDVDAEGNVVVDEGPNRLSASRLRYNLTTKLGLFEDARADLDPSYHFTGRIVEKVGPDSYVFEDGVFTSCDLPDPGWSFRVARGEVTLGGYATLHSTAFRASKVPLLWLPWILWPVKDDRTSGLLVPSLGYSNRWGAHVGTAWYQVLGPSADATAYLDGYTDGYVGFGAEVRRAFAGGGAADALGFALWDVEEGQLEWKARVRAREDNLPGGMRLTVDALAYSDPEFFRYFERAPSLTTLRTVTQAGVLSVDRGPFTLNLRAARRENLFDRYDSGGTIRESVIQQRLPGLELRSRPARLGVTPISWSIVASVDNLMKEREQEVWEGSPTTEPLPEASSTWFRADLYPRLSAGFRVFPWLSVAPEISLRETWYSKSLDPADMDGGYHLAGEAIERRVAAATVNVVGPSFARIFDGPIGRWARFKHVIEPRVEYRRTEFLGDVVDNSTVPQFDEVDFEPGIGGSEQVTASLVNRILARETKGGASAREIGSLRLSRRFVKDDPDRPGASQETYRSPLQLDLRVNPPGGVFVNGSMSYETEDRAGYSGITTTTLTAGWSGKDRHASVAWSGYHSLGPTSNQTGQVQFSFRTPVVADRLAVDIRYVHSLTEPATPLQRYLVEYRGSCWSLYAEYRDTNYGGEHRQDWRLSFNLRDVGTFFDVSGGLDDLPF